MNERHFDAYVSGAAGEPPWRLMCVYGELRTEDRHHMWSLLRDLCHQVDMPWAVIGDFNEAMWGIEHFSETPRSAGQMIDFRDVLEVCGLGDLGFAGLPYTYHNRQSGRANVKVRLDRAVANNACRMPSRRLKWSTWWPQVQTTLPSSSSASRRNPHRRRAGTATSTK